jgi:nicotinic acid mononucleotide adenylyltransferase
LTRWHAQHLGHGADVARRPAGVVVPIAMKPVDCSSTELRAALARAAQQSRAAAPAAMLPPAVLDYIRQHRLYP